MNKAQDKGLRDKIRSNRTLKLDENTPFVVQNLHETIDIPSHIELEIENAVGVLGKKNTII